ncbi:MAG: hypothetical protein JJU29_17030 [Verrucomicrobia bacterium]|nr:hypothetical protein [Verrucomicrobiota bacterium]MCH8512414.1 hypothetical protein [Kiritimatiellia bacterium]
MFHTTFENPGGKAHVLMPGALVDGNRFEAIRVPYSPRYPADRAGPEMPTLMSDVPRLAHRLEEPSKVQFFSGHMSWPALACWHPDTRDAFLVTAPSHVEGHEVLWELSEDPGHEWLSLLLRCPGGRETRFAHMRTDAPAHDPSPEGKNFDIPVTVKRFQAEDLPAFYRKTFAFWAEALGKHAAPASCPLSHAFDLIADKYDRENWFAEWGLYLTVPDPDNKYPYQTGWCGGGIAAYALGTAPASLTRERAAENLRRVCTEAPTSAGLLYGCRRRAGWLPDFHEQPEHPHTWKWTLTRRQGDALYYLTKDLLRTPPKTDDPRPTAAKNLTKAFVTKRRIPHSALPTPHSPWGHFLDNETGEVLIGGTASGAIIPGALALMHQVTGDPEALAIAEAAAELYYQAFTRKGMCNGGPGDALGCPDSESAFALVESFVWLWQISGKAHWLEKAETAAQQALMWVMPYAWPFPADSEFGRLRIDGTGTVFANVQNKHSAPGICTHSGEGLLRLFRATGDARYLHGLRAIVRALPQCLSRPDRPIHDPAGRPLPAGWMNERVNTNDWDNNVGGVFYGSCWCEISLLLAYQELPGVVAQPDTGLVCCLDHVHAEWTGVERHSLRISNPTPYPARVRLLIESSTEAKETRLQPGFAETLPVVCLEPGENIVKNMIV